MITIVTATYNRAHLLSVLYDSLINQTNKDFEWIIVDDGSKDNTDEVVAHFMNAKQLNINYLKKANGGKHTAFNLGVRNAKGAYIFNVDSDDRLPHDAIAKLMAAIHVQEKDYPECGGVVLRKAYFDNTMVGSEIPNPPLLSNSIVIRRDFKVTGDFAEVFKIDILKANPFPENDEKFCPEILVWNRIALKYNLLFFNDIIYQCEYIEGGLTANIVKIRMKSPINTCTCYAEMYAINKDFPKEKAKALINFWRFYQAASAEAKKEIKIPQSNFNFLFKILGTIFHKKDLKTTAS